MPGRRATKGQRAQLERRAEQAQRVRQARKAILGLSDRLDRPAPLEQLDRLVQQALRALKA